MDPENTPGEQGNSQQQGQSDPNNYEARYKGLVRKVEEVTLQNKQFETELGQALSLAEQFKTQLSIKDTEKAAAIAERDRLLQETTTKNLALEKEVNDLRALEKKLKVVREMGRPELATIIDTIPNMTDEEALKSVFSSISAFTDAQVKSREQQLLAGVTPNNTNNQKVTAPQNREEWLAYLDKLDPRSNEFKKAQSDYVKAMTALHSKKD